MQNLTGPIGPYLQHNVVPIVQSITPQQSRIALAVAAIFATLAAIFLFVYSCIWRKGTSVEAPPPSSTPSPTTTKTAQVFVSTPVDPKQSVTLPEGLPVEQATAEPTQSLSSKPQTE